MLIKFTDNERKTLKKLSMKNGFNVSEYIKRKLFHENEDLSETDVFISPSNDKNNLLTLSVVFKTFYMARELLEKLGYSKTEIENVEKKSLEYARSERERYGYKIIKAKDE